MRLLSTPIDAKSEKDGVRISDEDRGFRFEVHPQQP
jgi:hypothetical protein